MRPQSFFFLPVKMIYINNKLCYLAQGVLKEAKKQNKITTSNSRN